MTETCSDQRMGRCCRLARVAARWHRHGRQDNCRARMSRLCHTVQLPRLFPWLECRSAEDARSFRPPPRGIPSLPRCEVLHELAAALRLERGIALLAAKGKASSTAVPKAC